MSWGRVVLICDRSLHDARSLTLGCTFLACSGWRRRELPLGAMPEGSGEAKPACRRRARRSQPSDVGRGGARPRGSGEAEPALRGRARSSPRPWCRARRSPPPEVGRGGVRPQRPAEAKRGPNGRVRRSADPEVGRGGARTQGSDEAERRPTACSLVGFWAGLGWLVLI